MLSFSHPESYYRNEILYQKKDFYKGRSKHVEDNLNYRSERSHRRTHDDLYYRKERSCKQNDLNYQEKRFRKYHDGTSDYKNLILGEIRQGLNKLEKDFERFFKSYEKKLNQQKEEKKELQVVWVEPRKSADEKKVEVVSDDNLNIVKEVEVIEEKPNSDVAELEGMKDDDMIEQPSVEQVLIVKAEKEKEVIADVDTCLQVKEDPGQRENLFHTRCLIQGKTCKLTVDSGSCANVVSQEIVKKMQLPVIPHPKPYGLRWLNAKNVLHIHQQAKVPISIGKYCDTVLCDVTPMDTTHVLLGRPWQYDRRAIYDGYRNTYTIEKNGQYFKMLPMTRADVLQEKFVHVKTNCQRSLFLLPCRSSQMKKKKSPQKLQELQHIPKEDPTNLNAKIRGRIFSKKGRMMRTHQGRVNLTSEKDQALNKLRQTQFRSGKQGSSDQYKFRDGYK